MHFHVIVNQPGYSPMSDNFPRFETIKEAWECVVDELERDYDSDLDLDPEDVEERYRPAITAAMWDHLAPGYVHVPGPTNTHLGMVYNVIECDNPECPDED
jgi:hypothetical protein